MIQRLSSEGFDRRASVSVPDEVVEGTNLAAKSKGEQRLHLTPVLAT